ncbi:MAG: hypothetical protein VW875_18400, partial [Planctomycetaceae bacterium]
KKFFEIMTVSQAGQEFNRPRIVLGRFIKNWLRPVYGIARNLVGDYRGAGPEPVHDEDITSDEEQFRDQVEREKLRISNDSTGGHKSLLRIVVRKV